MTLEVGSCGSCEGTLNDVASREMRSTLMDTPAVEGSIRWISRWWNALPSLELLGISQTLITRPRLVVPSREQMIKSVNKNTCASSLRDPGFFCVWIDSMYGCNSVHADFILAACDVEANFLVVKAYNYTTLLSCMLLDA